MVAADSVHGVGEVETALRHPGKGHVPGVGATHPFHSWNRKPAVSGTAESIAQGLDASACRELADLDADEFNPTLDGPWTRGPLVRRGLADGAHAFFTTWCPASTRIKALVQVEGQRWAIEDSLDAAKAELGLDHNETRSWHGWHRHASLVMLAAMRAAIRHRANQPAPQKHRRASPDGSTPHPPVGPGTPPRRHPLGTAPHPASPPHRMVTLAQGAPSHRATLAFETNYATVMLSRLPLIVPRLVGALVCS